MEPPTKRFKYSKKIEIKSSIVDKFKDIINDVDIEAESLLLNINHEPAINRINQQRNSMITEIEKLIKLNLDKLDKNTQMDEIELKDYEDILIDNCVYFDTETLGDFILGKNRLGLLVIFDYMMTESQLDVLKEDLILFFDKLQYTRHHESRELVPENMYLIEQIRNALIDDHILLRVEQKKFQDIKEISISPHEDHNEHKFISIPNINIFNQFTNLRKVLINGMYFITIRKKWFNNLNLEELDLSSNSTESIEKDAFSNLKSLKKLDLSYNNLRQIKSGTFDNLTELEELNLSSNYLETISGTLFKDLKSLKRLDLTNLGLNEIKNATLSSLSNLQVLYIQGNSCTYATNSLKKLDNLESIVMSYEEESPESKSDIQASKNLRKLTYINIEIDANHLKWINKNRYLTEMTLYIRSFKANASFFNKFNNLHELALERASLNFEKFPDLENLKKLKLSRVTFKKCADNLFTDINLEEIVILKCIFEVKTDLNQMIAKLKKAKKLTVVMGKASMIENHDTDSDTDIDDYDDHKEDFVNPNPNVIQLRMDQSIANSLSSLTELFLIKNTLDRNYEHIFKGLVNLEKLSIERNSLRAIHKNAFEGLTNLKDLSLADNCFESIDKNIFSPLENSLETLAIFSCKLKSSDLKIIENLRELDALDISANKIDVISSDVFRNLKKLQELDLSLLEIRKLENNVFSDLTSLKTLDLRYNHFSSLKEGVFNGIENLTELEISNNKIQKIDHLFDKLKNIKYFLASGTNVKSVDIEKIENLKQIEVINLENCKIKEIDYKLLNRLMIKKYGKFKINLNGNPFSKNKEPKFMNLLNLNFKV